MPNISAAKPPSLALDVGRRCCLGVGINSSLLDAAASEVHGVEASPRCCAIRAFMWRAARREALHPACLSLRHGTLLLGLGAADFHTWDLVSNGSEWQWSLSVQYRPCGGYSITETFLTAPVIGSLAALDVKRWVEMRMEMVQGGFCWKVEIPGTCTARGRLSPVLSPSIFFTFELYHECDLRSSLGALHRLN